MIDPDAPAPVGEPADHRRERVHAEDVDADHEPDHLQRHVDVLHVHRRHHHHHDHHDVADGDRGHRQWRTGDVRTMRAPCASSATIPTCRGSSSVSASGALASRAPPAAGRAGAHPATSSAASVMAAAVTRYGPLNAGSPRHLGQVGRRLHEVRAEYGTDSRRPDDHGQVPPDMLGRGQVAGGVARLQTDGRRDTDAERADAARGGRPRGRCSRSPPASRRRRSRGR